MRLGSEHLHIRHGTFAARDEIRQRLTLFLLGHEPAAQAVRAAKAALIRAAAPVVSEPEATRSVVQVAEAQEARTAGRRPAATAARAAWATVA